MGIIARILATGFGLGLSPVVPGTVGTLPGILFCVLMIPLPLGWQIAASLVLTVLAVPICGLAEKSFGTKDDRRIVADEFMTFPICVLGLPWMEHPWMLAVAFVTNRILDILKPPPAWQLQSVRGGWGIVLDDFVSCLYALALNHAIFRLVMWFAARGGAS